jgi:hypothetical protein
MEQPSDAPAPPKNEKPGVFERVYHLCLLHELKKAGQFVESEITLPIEYDRLKIDAAKRITGSPRASRVVSAVERPSRRIVAQLQCHSSGRRHKAIYEVASVV